MKQLTLNVLSRNQVGSGVSRRLRSAGCIPAVVYGESGSRNLSIETTEFLRLWKQVAGRTALIEIHSEGVEPMFTIIKAVQRDPLTDRFIHIDFREIQRGKDMVADIPIYARGEAHGVKIESGILETHLSEVTVRCRPRNLPECIEVDVSSLKLGDSLHVKHLPVVEGVTYISNADLVVFAVTSGKTEVEAAPADAAATAAS
jgi:large subunit ribosomal protein L25